VLSTIGSAATVSVVGMSGTSRASNCYVNAEGDGYCTQGDDSDNYYWLGRDYDLELDTAMSAERCYKYDDEFNGLAVCSDVNMDVNQVDSDYDEADKIELTHEITFYGGSIDWSLSDAGYDVNGETVTWTGSWTDTDSEHFGDNNIQADVQDFHGIEINDYATFYMPDTTERIQTKCEWQT
jgi:hypothetical protein